MTVDEVQHRIDSREFSEWMAYYQIDPFGEDRGDFRIAQLCALIANMFREKKQKPHAPADFMPDFGGDGSRAEKQSSAQIKNALMGFAALHNKSIKSKAPINGDSTKRLVDGSANS